MLPSMELMVEAWKTWRGSQHKEQGPLCALPGGSTAPPPSTRSPTPGHGGAGASGTGTPSAAANPSASGPQLEGPTSTPARSGAGQELGGLSSSPCPSPGAVPPTTQATAPEERPPAGSGQRACSKCSTPGHNATSCALYKEVLRDPSALAWTVAQWSRPGPVQLKCSFCGAQGHKKADCRFRRLFQQYLCIPGTGTPSMVGTPAARRVGGGPPDGQLGLAVELGPPSACSPRSPLSPHALHYGGTPPPRGASTGTPGPTPGYIGVAPSRCARPLLGPATLWFQQDSAPSYWIAPGSSSPLSPAPPVVAGARAVPPALTAGSLPVAPVTTDGTAGAGSEDHAREQDLAHLSTCLARMRDSTWGRLSGDGSAVDGVAARAMPVVRFRNDAGNDCFANSAVSGPLLSRHFVHWVTDLATSVVATPGQYGVSTRRILAELMGVLADVVTGGQGPDPVAPAPLGGLGGGPSSPTPAAPIAAVSCARLRNAAASVLSDAGDRRAYLSRGQQDADIFFKVWLWST